MMRIDVELLTGRYVASSFNDRRKAEWPPHPARLYSTLVALWAEDELGDSVARALDWLSDAGNPEVLAARAAARAVPPFYVPDIGRSLLSRTHDAFVELECARELVAAARLEGDTRSIRAASKQLTTNENRYRKAFERDAAYTETGDASAVEAAARLLPSRRTRQPRWFPSVRPASASVSFVWPEASPAADVRAALALVLSRVHRLGHSSSMVACALVDGPPDDTDTRTRWVPAEEGDLVLRTVAKGQRERLAAAFRNHAAVEPRILPCAYQRYGSFVRRQPTASPRSVFGSKWIVFRVVPANHGRTELRLTRAPDIARALRRTLMRYADDPPPALITGHTPDGKPLERSHAAWVPLADVVHEHSSGSVLGIAIVLPRAFISDEHHALLRAIGVWEQESGEALPLRLERSGVLWLERVRAVEDRSTLQPGSWCGPGRHWATVTPIALDRNPGNLNARDPRVAETAAAAAQDIIARACERIGLPRPAQVQTYDRSVFPGAPGAWAFAPFPRKEDALRRVCVHAELLFEEAVEGPLLVGAGRYQGVGLLRPVTRTFA